MELSFIIKKIISIFIEPLSIFFILFLIGIELINRKQKLATKILVFSFFYLAIISHTKIANMFLYPLENSYKKVSTIKKIDYIVLIGGDRFERAWEVLRLKNKIENVKIIVSGYEGRGVIPEAFKAKKLLVESGIKKTDIITLPKPKDTIEEAIAIKKLIGDKQFYLITSAYHMVRASIIFKKYNLNFIPAPVNFLIKDSDKWLSFPSYWGLYKISKAIHEYIGILWLFIKEPQLLLNFYK